MKIDYKMEYQSLGDGYWKGILTDHRDNIISMVEGECLQPMAETPDPDFFGHLAKCAFIGMTIREYVDDDDKPDLRIVRDGNWD